MSQEKLLYGKTLQETLDDNEVFTGWLYDNAKLGDLLSNGDILTIAMEMFNNQFIDSIEAEFDELEEVCEEYEEE